MAAEIFEKPGAANKKGEGKFPSPEDFGGIS
jgi:hypothetical protein